MVTWNGEFIRKWRCKTLDCGVYLLHSISQGSETEARQQALYAASPTAPAVKKHDHPSYFFPCRYPCAPSVSASPMPVASMQACGGWLPHCLRQSSIGFEFPLHLDDDKAGSHIKVSGLRMCDRITATMALVLEMTGCMV